MKLDVFRVLIMSFLLSSCASLSNEQLTQKMLPKQRIYVGHISVNLNNNLKPNCELYINQDIVPSLKLSSDGLVVFKSDREKFKISQIACYYMADEYRAAWHLHDLDFEKIERSNDANQVNYFGDVKLIWNVTNEDTINAANLEHDNSTPLKIGRVKDSGRLEVSISSDIKTVEQEFYKKNPDMSQLNLLFAEKLFIPIQSKGK